MIRLSSLSPLSILVILFGLLYLITTTEIKCIWKMGKILRDRIRNGDIRQQLSTDTANDYIKTQQIM
jgi:hypothetical protein